MKKIAVLVEEGYQVLEVWYPYLRLREAGMHTVLVGTGKGVYKSKDGYPAQEEAAIKDIKAIDFDAVVIPGGWAPDFLRRSSEVLSFVKTMHEAGKVVASICHGGWVLASAGILPGKKVTSFSAIKDDMVHAGAEFIDQEVVVDHTLITSRNPYDLPAFCREIIKSVGGSKG
ncbi:MAG: type 1 glutamine amidotransferase [Candidatus Omnitrophica bacterium]|nr:type 1 glutamine amidotransferase [Candidatus Omnitrophota bacterium]